jgi:hypothetical protein
MRERVREERVRTGNKERVLELQQGTLIRYLCIERDRVLRDLGGLSFARYKQVLCKHQWNINKPTIPQKIIIKINDVGPTREALLKG